MDNHKPVTLHHCDSTMYFLAFESLMGGVNALCTLSMSLTTIATPNSIMVNNGGAKFISAVTAESFEL